MACGMAVLIRFPIKHLTISPNIHSHKRYYINFVLHLSFSLVSVSSFDVCWWPPHSFFPLSFSLFFLVVFHISFAFLIGCTMRERVCVFFIHSRIIECHTIMLKAYIYSHLHAHAHIRFGFFLAYN